MIHPIDCVKLTPTQCADQSKNFDSGVILSPCGPLVMRLGDLSGAQNFRRKNLGTPLPQWGSSWVILGPSREAFWGYLGSSWVHVGHLWGAMDIKVVPRILEEKFWAPPPPKWGSSGVILGPSREAFWGTWGHLGSRCGHLY